MDVERKPVIPVRVVSGFGGLMGASPAEAVDRLPAGGKKVPKPEVAPDNEGRSGFMKLAETPPDDS